MNSINFLIENNYADSELAASKILEAASDEFIDYIIKESIRSKLSSYIKNRVKKSRALKHVKRFLGYTTLGAIASPFLQP